MSAVPLLAGWTLPTQLKSSLQSVARSAAVPSERGRVGCRRGGCAISAVHSRRPHTSAVPLVPSFPESWRRRTVYRASGREKRIPRRCEI